MANQYTKQPFDLARAIQLYESGMSQTEVASELGTTQKVVHDRFREAGYKCRVAAKRNQMGEANHMWKGDAATISAMHIRLYKRFGQPSKCAVCGTDDPSKSYDWANLTGKYEDVHDYKRMCRSCHWKYDDKKQNWKGAVGGRPSPKKGVMPHASK
jgi:hypothetical protein